MEADALPPVVPLPERLDRTLRLGPFPSGRDALKFLSYVAIGALLVPWGGVVAWLAFVLVGLAVSVWRPEGDGIDTRAVRLLRWKLRAIREARSVTASGVRPSARRGVVALSPWGQIAVVRTGGIPLAYLPPGDLQRRFDHFRELLRGLDRSMVILASRAPIHVGPLLPSEPAPTGEERVAREGYRELIEVIARRRHVRQVFLAVVSRGSGSDGLGALETHVATLLEQLAALGLRSARLRDRALTDAAMRLGLLDREPGA